MDKNDNLSPQFGTTDYHEQVTDGLHPPAMFATPGEILDTHVLGDWDGWESKDELLDRKREAADGPPEHEYFEGTPLAEKDRQSGHYGGLTENIKEEGYDWSKPVQVRAIGPDGIVTNGHHRLAVMARDRPDEFIPLKTTY